MQIWRATQNIKRLSRGPRLPNKCDTWGASKKQNGKTLYDACWKCTRFQRGKIGAGTRLKRTSSCSSLAPSILNSLNCSSEYPFQLSSSYFSSGSKRSSSSQSSRSWMSPPFDSYQKDKNTVGKRLTEWISQDVRRQRVTNNVTSKRLNARFLCVGLHKRMPLEVETWPRNNTTYRLCGLRVHPPLPVSRLSDNYWAFAMVYSSSSSTDSSQSFATHVLLVLAAGYRKVCRFKQDHYLFVHQDSRVLARE